MQQSKVPVFTIITPCLNAETLLRQTVDSVLNQSALANGRANLQYIICDGGSNDGTQEMIDAFKNPSITFVSGSDTGMYHGLSKGLLLAQGDFTAYLNAGDLYHSSAFDVVLDIFQSQEINWLTGLIVYLNSDSAITGTRLPFRYRRKYIQAGLYGRTLPFIQQEGTFWRSILNSAINHQELISHQYAGDYYLWNRFAQSNSLYIAESHLGGFRIHEGQLSEQLDAYLNEVRSITPLNRVLWLLSWIDWLLWLAPNKLKDLFNPYLLRYHHKERKWK